MTVVISDFEIIPPSSGPGQAEPGKGEPRAPAAAPPPPPARREVERALAHTLERLSRVRAD